MMQRIAVLAAAAALLAAAPRSLPAQSADAKAQLAASIDARATTYADLAHRIWTLAEVGYQETQSSAALQAELRRAGFQVEAGVAGIPTAFVATYGRGEPTIGILAEFDALPGLSQDAVPERQPREGSHAGHACGHHLFGTASSAAAIAVKEWLARTGGQGTIRLYGTPAEEGGGGKIYLARAGLFEDVDVVLDWHPGSENDAGPSTSLANISGKFRFRGVSAHAAGAPERGRSALDGLEAMNHMVNLMREHVPDGTRIHYVITSGGSAPNVVPDYAEVYYYARHAEARVVEQLWERIVKASEGAALGTGTTVSHEVLNGVHSLLPNEALARAVHANLERVGGVTYSAEERVFAERIRQSLGDAARPLEEAGQVKAFGPGAAGGSTDVGDVSWIVPNSGFSTATWVPGTAAHSWQAVAAGGMGIGHKGMMVAAKTLAMTAHDLFTRPELVAEARAEFERRRGPGFQYRSLVGDRDPPLDYRR